LADTIFGNTPFTAAMQGYSQGVQIQTEKQQNLDQTSLLSDKAQLSKMNVASLKQEQALSLAAKAARADAAAKNLDVDASTNQGQVKLIDAALGAVKNNPELSDRLFKQKSQLLSEQAGIATAQGKLREEEQYQVYDGIRSAFINPENSHESLMTMAQNSTNQQTKAKLLGLAHITSPGSTIPVPGYGKPFSSLTPLEQDSFRADVIRAVAPSKVEKTAADIQAEIIKERELEERRRHNLAEEAAQLKRIAAQREGNKIKGDKARDKSNQIAKEETSFVNDVGKIEKQQIKILSDAGIANPDDMVKNWLTLGLTEKPVLNPGQKAAYEALEKQKQERAAVKERNIAKFKAVDQTPNPPVGTKENPIKLD
jgi:hypothetical protein